MEASHIITNNEEEIWKGTRSLLKMDTNFDDVSSAIILKLYNSKLNKYIELKIYKSGEIQVVGGTKQKIKEVRVYKDKTIYVTDNYKLILTRKLINENIKSYFSIGETGIKYEIIKKGEEINISEEQKEIELQKSDIFIPEEEQRMIQRAITPEIENTRTNKSKTKEKPIMQKVPINVPHKKINYEQPVKPIQENIMQNTYFQPPPLQPLYQQYQQGIYQPIYQQPIQPIMQRIPVPMGMSQMQTYPYGQQNMRQPMLQRQPLGQPLGQPWIPMTQGMQRVPIVQGMPGTIRQPRMQGPPIIPLTEKGRQTILQPFKQYKPGQLPSVNTLVQKKPTEKKKKDLTPKYNLKEIVNNPNFHQQMRELILTPNTTTPKKEVKKRTRTVRKVVEKGKKGEDLKQVTTPIQDPDDTATEEISYIIIDDEETEEVK